MKTPVKLLSLFTLSLAAIFAAAWGAGALAGPLGTAGDEHMTTAHDSQPHTDPPDIPGGLQIAQDGYRLTPLSTELSITDTRPLRFAITGPDGRPVTAYTPVHDKALHLVVVRRDLTGYQHLHPVLGDDGIWSIPFRAGEPGQYRMFADFQPAARSTGLILGADLAAPGHYQPQRMPQPAKTAVTGDYTVTVDGDLIAGTSSQLTLTVTRAGQPVTDLQPYLGAYGHLVALRDGDLAYLHVHPQHSASAGPHIVFAVEVPSAGIYGLFLDFQHNGIVHTAQVIATATTASAAAPSPASHGH